VSMVSSFCAVARRAQAPSVTSLKYGWIPGKITENHHEFLPEEKN